jgi:DNA mismatch repair protein MLH1
VIHRPSNALKELLENALDANARSISVVCKDGGNKLLAVQDDGDGVDISDLPLLCARHATSKIVKYEDLRECSTFGFRGEALASMSYVAHVTATTMTENAEYASGRLM